MKHIDNVVFDCHSKPIELVFLLREIDNGNANIYPMKLRNRISLLTRCVIQPHHYFASAAVIDNFSPSARRQRFANCVCVPNKIHQIPLCRSIENNLIPCNKIPNSNRIGSAMAWARFASAGFSSTMAVKCTDCNTNRCHVQTNDQLT